MAHVIASNGSYRFGFGLLLVPALLSLGLVIFSRSRYPDPRGFESASTDSTKCLPRAYWMYVAAGALIGFGFVDFSLIAFHFQRAGTFTTSLIPISYAVAMGTGAVGNYLLGRWLDRTGFPVVVGTFVVGAVFTPLLFFGSRTLAWVGMALWGLNKGAQDTILKPAIAPLISPTDERRPSESSTRVSAQPGLPGASPSACCTSIHSVRWL